MARRWTTAAAAVAFVGASCTGSVVSKHTASTTTCGVWLSARLPTGARVPLTSCAGLAGITPSEAITLKVGQTVTITSAAANAGVRASGLATNNPAVLAPASVQATVTQFVARSAGSAEIVITTGACTAHNGTFAPCPVSRVTVAGGARPRHVRADAGRWQRERRTEVTAQDRRRGRYRAVCWAARSQPCDLIPAGPVGRLDGPCSASPDVSERIAESALP